MDYGAEKLARIPNWLIRALSPVRIKWESSPARGFRMEFSFDECNYPSLIGPPDVTLE